MQSIKEIILERQNELISEMMKLRFEFYDSVNKLIQESNEREKNETNESVKEYHHGVQRGMTHVLILLGRIW
jgi:hypothetical protein